MEASKDRGQATLEMALALPLVFTLIMGVLELGLGFNAYVTLAASAREGARAGAIYLYDPSYSQVANDQNRETGTGTGDSYTDNIRDAVASSLGILRSSSPNFDRNSSVTITYDPPAGTTLSRKGDLVAVQVSYRHDLLSQVLSTGASFYMTAQASARIE